MGRTIGLASKETPLLRFVEARRLARSGEQTAALEHLGAGPTQCLLSRGLLAEIYLDRAEPEQAIAVAQQLLAASAGHPAGVQALIEARDGLEQDLTPEERTVVEQACGASEPRVPTLAAACHLHAALAARRAGKRAQALAEARRAAEIEPIEPRLLAINAQHLANLGAVQQAAALLARATRMADERLPPLAWARAGVALARTRKVTIPPGPPPGPEARLIASRAAFVGEPLAEEIRPEASSRDPDLAFLRAGDRAVRSHQSAQMRKKLWVQYRRRPPGPIAAYVAGTLAKREQLDDLALLWLERALGGHGDACRATYLYSAVLTNLGRTPARNGRLQRAIGKLDCPSRSP
jgi:hypothetical protein